MTGEWLKRRWWLPVSAVAVVLAVTVPLVWWWSGSDDAEFSESARCEPEELPLPPDADAGIATAVSSGGEYLGGRVAGRPVLWHDGDVSVVGAPGRIDAGVQAVSSAGVAVGYTDSKHGDDWVSRDGQIHTLLPPDSSYEYTETADVNDSGVIAGHAAGPTRGAVTALLWEDGATVASALGQGRARAISDDGVVVGEAPADDDKVHPRVWVEGEAVDLPAFDGDGNARALAVTAKWVLLEARGDTPVYFRWKLDTDRPEKLDLVRAYGIDSSGRAYGVAESTAPAEQDGAKVTRLPLPDGDSLPAAVSPARASDVSGKVVAGQFGAGDDAVPLRWACD